MSSTNGSRCEWNECLCVNDEKLKGVFLLVYGFFKSTRGKKMLPISPLKKIGGKLGIHIQPRMNDMVK